MQKKKKKEKKGKERLISFKRLARKDAEYMERCIIKVTKGK